MMWMRVVTSTNVADLCDRRKLRVPWCQVCRRWRHRRLSLWQSPVSPMTTYFEKTKIVMMPNLSLLEASAVVAMPTTSGAASNEKVGIISMASHEYYWLTNHRQLDCLFNILFRLTSKKISKLCITSWLLVRREIHQWPVEIVSVPWRHTWKQWRCFTPWLFILPTCHGHVMGVSSLNPNMVYFLHMLLLCHVH